MQVLAPAHDPLTVPLTRYVENRQRSGREQPREKEEQQREGAAAEVTGHGVGQRGDRDQAEEPQPEAARAGPLAGSPTVLGVDPVVALVPDDDAAAATASPLPAFGAQQVGLGIPEPFQSLELLLELWREAVARIAGHYTRKVSTAIWFVGIASLVFGPAACVGPKRSLGNDLREVSGLVARPGGGFVAINDGGNPPALHFLDGRLRGEGQVEVAGRNTDWEGLTTSSGSLVICDIGDNLAVRDSIDVLLVDSAGRLTARRTFGYPDGARDAEACFASEGEIHLIAKAPVAFFGGGEHRYARHYVGSLRASDATGRLRLVDSLDLGPWSVTDAKLDGGRLALLTYDFRRWLGLPLTRTTLFEVDLRPDGRFAPATLRSRRVRAPLTPTQYEALALLDDATAVIASERTFLVAPRWRVVRRPGD